MSTLRPQLFSFLAPLAFFSVLATEPPAQAALIYNIYQSGPDVVIETSGSLNLSGLTPFAQNYCGGNGAIYSTWSIICTGPNALLNLYLIDSGPSPFGNGVPETADSANGPESTEFATSDVIGINTNYLSGDPIVSNAIFNNKTLSALGLNVGLFGPWTLMGSSETISVNVVPGPLPVLGAGAAFGFSRRLRRRIQLGQQAAKG